MTPQEEALCHLMVRLEAGIELLEAQLAEAQAENKALKKQVKELEDARGTDES